MPFFLPRRLLLMGPRACGTDPRLEITAEVLAVCYILL